MLTLLTACERFGDEDPGPGSAESGETGDTAPDTDALLGIEEVGRDADSLAEIGLVDITYAVTDTHLPVYRTNEGGDPRFHLLVSPDWIDDGTAHPLLVWLHGGVAGIEDDDDNSGAFCTAAGVADLVDNALHSHGFLFGRAAERGWMVMVPESTWCDLWAGLGPEDPHDTDHASTWHVLTALDAVQAGLGGLRLDPAQVYAWGTSIGGSGTFPLAHGFGETPSRFAGLVSDSGPVVTSLWYHTPSQVAVLDHLFGGSPELFHDNYARVDADLLIREQGFRVPVFSAYNTYDGFTAVAHGQTLDATLDELYGTVRSFHKDWYHHAPGDQYHTQTQISEPPYAYTGEAAMRFLAGGSVQMVEAEALCESCTVLTEADTSPNAQAARMSGGAGVARLQPAGAGILFSAGVPADVPRDRPLSVVFVLLVDGTSTPADELVTLRVGDSTSRTVTAGELAIGSTPGTAADLSHVAATTLEGVTIPSGDVPISVIFHGIGNAYLDAIYFIDESVSSSVTTSTRSRPPPLAR